MACLHRVVRAGSVARRVRRESSRDLSVIAGARSRRGPAACRTRNGPACKAALERRGSLTIWFVPDMAWQAAPAGQRGRQPDYSDAAIQIRGGSENSPGDRLRCKRAEPDAVRRALARFRVFGGTPGPGIQGTAVDRLGRGKVRQINTRFPVMTSHHAFEPEFRNPAGWGCASEAPRVRARRRRAGREERAGFPSPDPSAEAGLSASGGDDRLAGRALHRILEPNSAGAPASSSPPTSASASGPRPSATPG